MLQPNNDPVSSIQAGTWADIHPRAAIALRQNLIARYSTVFSYTYDKSRQTDGGRTSLGTRSPVFGSTTVEFVIFGRLCRKVSMSYHAPHACEDTLMF